jgi:hypothetical protein
MREMGFARAAHRNFDTVADSFEPKPVWECSELEKTRSPHEETQAPCAEVLGMARFEISIAEILVIRIPVKRR